MENAREALLKTRGLNLGSGQHYAPGWVNVDKNPPGGEHRPPDVLIDVFDLADTFPPGSFKAVYLGHFLEHIPWDRIPQVIGQIIEVSKWGAPVMAVGPCLWRALDTGQPRSILEAIVANPATCDGSGLGHAWTPTADLTRQALILGGLVDVATVPIQGVTKPEWPNPSTALWQTAAFGRVPG